MSTPFQVNFFYPLIKKLETHFEILITARNHDRILPTLKAKRLNFTPVGRHGGAELLGKLESYADTVKQLAPIIQHEKPDLLLTERWPEAVRVAFGLNIPAWTIFYDEREQHVNKMVFPLSSLVFCPRFYTYSDLKAHGVTDPEKVAWFDGFHTCYLKDETFDDKNPFLEMGVSPPVVLVRPEPEFATFFEQKKNILEEAVQRLGTLKEKPSIVVLPRTESQADRYKKLGTTVIADSFNDNPAAHSDVVIGAAETMLMESFVIGKPTVSNIYWTESRPVIEMHKYVPHITDSQLVAKQVQRFLDPDEQVQFKQRSRSIVEQMENPVDRILEEIVSRYLSREHPLKLSRRSRLELYMDILSAAGPRSIRLVHLMQSANLSHSDAKKSLSHLMRKGFVTESTEGPRGSFFRTTPEGLQLLKSYASWRSRLVD